MLLDFPSVLDERLKRRAVGNLLGSDSFQVFQFRLVLAGKSSHRPGNSPFKRRWYRSERLLQETHPSFFFFVNCFTSRRGGGLARRAPAGWISQEIIATTTQQPASRTWSRRSSGWWLDADGRKAPCEAEAGRVRHGARWPLEARRQMP